MKILFIYDCFQLGGTETLILRMATALKRDNHHVHLMLKERDPHTNLYSNQQLLDQIKQYVTIIYAGEDCRNVRTCVNIALPCTDYDYIYGFDTTSFLVGVVLAQTYRMRIPVIAGVYHPREYCFKRNHPRYMPHLMEKLLRNMPEENIFFMNQACLDTHAKCIDKTFEDSPLVPLPVDVSRFSSVQRKPNRLKIVSVGRIVNFKTYNFTMVEVIKALRQKNYNVEYHIYGRGHQKESLIQYIKESGLDDCIVVHEIVEYEQLPLVLADAGVFIGMGTSIIEAAACGVPSLIGIIANNRPTTYGFFHEIDQGYNVGEICEGLAEVPFLEKIEYLLNLTDDEYNQLQTQTKQSMQKFEITSMMQIFYQSLKQSRYYDYNITLLDRLIYAVDNFIWMFLRSRFIKIPDPLALQYAINEGT